MHRILLVLAALLAVAPIQAQRRGRGGSGGDVFKFLVEKYDKDKDGEITAEEYDRGAEKFAAYDRDGDGVIRQADFAGGSRGRRRGGRRAVTPTASIVGPSVAMTLAANADDNEDGKVTPTEWKKTLQTLDRNQDAIVDAEELNGIMCAALGRKSLSSRAIMRRARHIDTNKDGKVQLSELGAMFQQLDTNGDKVIVASELGDARTATRSGPPRVGEVAPDFELPMVKNEEKLVRLSSFRGEKPVALIFGSYT